MPSQEDQFDKLKSRAIIKKEAEKETEYKTLFLNLIKSNRDIFTAKHDNPQEYEAETKVLKKVLEVERDALIGAAAIGALAFFTVRFLPRVAVRYLGGESKAKAMEAAEAKQSLLKSAGGLLFEGTVAFWSGYRGYFLAVDIRSDDVYDEIVSLPLCEGRSIVSDTICDEWHRLIHHEVSPDFWKNMDEKNDGAKELRNQEFFQAVLDFDEACRKRRAFEDVIRLRENKRYDEPVSIPSSGVPHQILELAKEEVDAMVR